MVLRTSNVFSHALCLKLQSGGPFFPVLTGRKDSLASYFDEANEQIPSPDSNVTEMLSLFSQRGFNEKEIVSLLGT